MTIDPDSFRSVLGRFASGITVVTTRDAEQHDVGMTVSAFCSVSLAPPLVLVCIALAASMHNAILGASHFAVNILSAEQEAIGSAAHAAHDICDAQVGAESNQSTNIGVPAWQAGHPRERCPHADGQ